MGLCILAGGKIVAVYTTVTAFTLAWTHTVEKIEWQEDWRIAGDRLIIVAARVHGNGAGMEAPPDAHFDRSGWSWRPNVDPVATLTLRRSGATPDWQLCIDGGCGDLGAVVAADADPVQFVACNEGDGFVARAPVYDPPESSESEDNNRAR
jgi:hypothetical protein